MPPPPDDYVMRDDAGVTVIRLETQSLLGILDVNRVGGELTALIQGGVKNLILDLKHIEFAGSAALGMLLQLSSELQSRGGKLVLCGTSQLDQLLKVTRARGMFQIAATREEARELFE
jgi:anti-anti-sigma factor